MKENVDTTKGWYNKRSIKERVDSTDDLYDKEKIKQDKVDKGKFDKTSSLD